MSRTLLIIALGELGTNMLEAVSRANLFERIFVASRSKAKAVQRVNNALIGAGIEGFYPHLEPVSLDAEDPAFVRQIKAIGPDVIFSAPSLLPWWKVPDGLSSSLPFAGYTALHLAPMVTLRNRLAEADLDATWIGAAYPDVINSALSRSGYGPAFGIGNVQEPIPKIKAGIGLRRGIPARDVSVRLVAQHAFEYYAMREQGCSHLPPHLLMAEAGGVDVSAIGEEVLAEPFPFPFDLHFNRVTASAGLVALRALLSSHPQEIHLPGCMGLPGGYPVKVSRDGITLDLPECWTVEQAIDVNERSLSWDGVATIEGDGTIHYTDETSRALHELTGELLTCVSPETVWKQAKLLLNSLQ